MAEKFLFTHLIWFSQERTESQTQHNWYINSTARYSFLVSLCITSFCCYYPLLSDCILRVSCIIRLQTWYQDMLLKRWRVQGYETKSWHQKLCLPYLWPTASDCKNARFPHGIYTSDLVIQQKKIMLENHQEPNCQPSSDFCTHYHTFSWFCIVFLKELEKLCKI